MAQTLASRARNAPLELRTPHSVHDFVHASDVGSAVVHALEHRLTGEVPIGSGTTRSVSELVECLGGRWRAADVLDGAGASHAEEAADVSALRRVGWAPSRTDATFAGGPLASGDPT